MDDQLFNDPFASSISLLEADIFSGNQLQTPTWPDLDLDLDHDDDNIQDLAPPAANNATSSGSRRKLSHNAYERDRRKDLNELYSSLRSLLPNEDHTVINKPSTRHFESCAPTCKSKDSRASMRS